MANQKLKRILAIATTVGVILTGILFIVCCAHLYFTGGEEPYSRERVGEYLLITLAPSVITVSLALFGFILSALSEKEKEETTKRTKIELLESYSKNYDINAFEGETKSEILKLRKGRNIFKYVAYSFSAAVFLVILVYICFFAKFTTETINADIIAALAFALPMSALALGIHVPRLYVAEKSAQRELDLMRAYVRENKISKIECGEVQTKKKVDLALVTKCVLCAAAIVLIVLGVINGGIGDVFGKAVRICTECIGLG